MVVSHSYDAAGRETVLQYLKSDGTPITLYTATYDNVGNRLTVEELGGVGLGFAYDWADQLTREWRTGADAYDVTFSYDAAGNRATKQENAGLTTYTYDQANEILVETPPSGDSTTHTWDASGNLWVENTGGSLTTYAWDAENRLVTVGKPDGTRHTYTYAPDGLRTKKETPEGLLHHLWDGQNLLRESDENLDPVAQYTDFPGYWGGLVSQRRGSDSRFYGFDVQANTRLLADESEAVTDTDAYRAFGEAVDGSGSTPHPHRFDGREGVQRDEADRDYLRRRHRKPSLGGFLSRDPEWPKDGPNWYLYVRNRVPNRTDPSGLKGPADLGSDQWLKQFMEEWWQWVWRPVKESECARLHSLRDAFLRLPEGSPRRREVVREFYKSLVAYYQVHGYSLTARNMAHWLSGRGQFLSEEEREIEKCGSPAMPWFVVGGSKFPWDLRARGAMTAIQVRLIAQFGRPGEGWGIKSLETHTGTYGASLDILGSFGGYRVYGRMTCTERHLGGGSLASCRIAYWATDIYDWHAKGAIPNPPPCMMHVRDEWARELEGYGPRDARAYCVKTREWYGRSFTIDPKTY